jgi:hypothetical protein
MAARVAFLIGNQTFRPDSELLPLKGPANDIAALTRLFSDPGRGKFEVRKFLDKSHHDVLPDLEQALGGAAHGDLFVIYYSGHGKLARNGELCLATADTRKDALRSTSIPARHLRDLVEQSDCNEVVLLLDCCFSGAVGEGLRGDMGSELHVVADAGGFYMLTAGTGVQAARETARLPGDVVMGRFTAALVNGIASGAADQGRRGKILLSDLRHYLRQVVTGSTPQFFALRASGDPLISLSPAAAAPLLDVGVLADLGMLSSGTEDTVPSQTQPRILDEALTAARTINVAHLRARTLATIARQLPAETQAGILDEALTVARSIDDAHTRALALEEIAPQLPVEAQPRVLDEALTSARAIESVWFRASAVSKIALQLRVLDEALTVARTIDHVGFRVGTLAKIAPQLPAEAQRTVLKEVLTATRSSDDADLRARTLAKIAPQLPEAQPGILYEALAAARSVDEAGKRAFALAEIAPQLPREARPRALDLALTAAHSIDGDYVRASALIKIAPQLPREARSRVLDEALTAARSINNPAQLARKLAEIASQLPPEAQPRVLDEALTAARSSDKATSRALALAEIARQLPAETQSEILDEALAVARSIDDAHLRAYSLTEIAPRLPPEAPPSFVGEVTVPTIGRKVASVGCNG